MKGIVAMVRVHKWKLEERSRVLQELDLLGLITLKPLDAAIQYAGY